MQLPHRPKHARLNDFDAAAQRSRGAALIAHLRGHLFPGRQVAQLARLGDRLCQRFLAINMFAHGHGQGAGGSVAVVGNGNSDRIDGRAQFVKHFSKIAVEFGLRELLRFGLEMPFIHIAKGDKIAAAAGGVIRVAVAFACHADAGAVDAVVGAKDISDKRKGDGGRADGGRAEELAAGNFAGVWWEREPACRGEFFMGQSCRTSPPRVNPGAP